MTKKLLIIVLHLGLVLGLCGPVLASCSPHPDGLNGCFGNHCTVFQWGPVNKLFIGQYSSCGSTSATITQNGELANVAMVVQAGPDNFVDLAQYGATCLNFALIEQTSPEDYPYETIEQKIEWALWNLDWAGANLQCVMKNREHVDHVNED